jgi:hypothetical protein
MGCEEGSYVQIGLVRFLGALSTCLRTVTFPLPSFLLPPSPTPLRFLPSANMLLFSTSRFLFGHEPRSLPARTDAHKLFSSCLPSDDSKSPPSLSPPALADYVRDRRLTSSPLSSLTTSFRRRPVQQSSPTTSSSVTLTTLSRLTRAASRSTAT